MQAGAGVQRNSVLSFLAQLETEELAPLFCLLLKPLQAAFLGNESLPSVDSVTEWETAITEGKVTAKFIDWIDCRAVVTLPYKRKMGFLHMVRDSLDIFDRERLGPYLHALLGVVFKCLESTTGTGSEEPEEDIEKAGSIGRDKVESMDSDSPELAEGEASAAIISTAMDIDLTTVVTDVQPSSSVTQIDDSTEVVINGKGKCSLYFYFRLQWKLISHITLAGNNFYLFSLVHGLIMQTRKNIWPQKVPVRLIALILRSLQRQVQVAIMTCEHYV